MNGQGGGFQQCGVIGEFLICGEGNDDMGTGDVFDVEPKIVGAGVAPGHAVVLGIVAADDNGVSCGGEIVMGAGRGFGGGRFGFGILGF